MSQRLILFWYGLVIFLSSALLMVLEIVAGRIIAPYVGVSLYTWSSVIGVVLGGLSLGNWLGGRWADKGAAEREVGLILLGSAASSIAILLLLTFIAPFIQAVKMNLLGASFLYVLALFFIPSTLLGVISPILTTMAINLDTRAGHIVGRMNALAALGSILGTFAAGYWLIQYFGTRAIVITVAVLLFILGGMFLFRRHKKVLAILLLVNVVIGGGTYARDGFVNFCDKESAYFCIRVVSANDMVPRGEARAMVLDHLVHGINYRIWPDIMFSPYVHVMDEINRVYLGERFARAEYFFSGGGAYTYPRAVRAHSPEAGITVAELDEDVTRIAKQRLFFDDNGMNIMHLDARAALSRVMDRKFDVVIGDVFHDVVAPYHFVTREYAALVKAKLKEDGIYILNMIDVPADPLLVKALYKTLKTEFAEVDIWIEHGKQDFVRQTYVVSAHNSKSLPETIDAQHGFKRQWHKLTAAIMQKGMQLADIPLLTDDYAPVERLTSSLVMREYGL